MKYATKVRENPMKNMPDGSAAHFEPSEGPYSYDVIVHGTDGDALRETEDLPGYGEALAALEEYRLQFPSFDVNFRDF